MPVDTVPLCFGASGNTLSPSLSGTACLAPSGDAAGARRRGLRADTAEGDGRWRRGVSVSKDTVSVSVETRCRCQPRHPGVRRSIGSSVET